MEKKQRQLGENLRKADKHYCECCEKAEVARQEWDFAVSKVCGKIRTPGEHCCSVGRGQAFKAVLLLRIIYVISVLFLLLLWIIFYVISVLFLLCFRARLFNDALWSPAGKGLTSWLSFVMSNCEVVTYPLVSWVRSGA